MCLQGMTGIQRAMGAEHSTGCLGRSRAKQSHFSSHLQYFGFVLDEDLTCVCVFRFQILKQFLMIEVFCSIRHQAQVYHLIRFSCYYLGHLMLIRPVSVL